MITNICPLFSIMYCSIINFRRLENHIFVNLLQLNRNICIDEVKKLKKIEDILSTGGL